MIRAIRSMNKFHLSTYQHCLHRLDKMVFQIPTYGNTLEGVRLKTRSTFRDLLYLSYILLQNVRMLPVFATIFLWISTIFERYTTSEGTHGAGLCDSIFWISTIFELYDTSEGTHGAGLCDSIFWISISSFHTL